MWAAIGFTQGRRVITVGELSCTGLYPWSLNLQGGGGGGGGAHSTMGDCRVCATTQDVDRVARYSTEELRYYYLGPKRAGARCCVVLGRGGAGVCVSSLPPGCIMLLFAFCHAT